MRRPIPAETLAAYYRNADLWDVRGRAHGSVRRRGQGPDLPRVLLQSARGLRPAHPAARRQQHGQAQQGAVPQAERRVLLLGGPVHGRQPRAAGVLAGQEARLRQHGARQADRYLQCRARLQGQAGRGAAAQSHHRLEPSQAARAREGRHQRGAVRAPRGDAAHRHLSRVHPRGRARLADLWAAREGRPDRPSDDGRHHGLEPAAPLHAARGRRQRHQRRRACAPIASATPT